MITGRLTPAVRIRRAGGRAIRGAVRATSPFEYFRGASAVFQNVAFWGSRLGRGPAIRLVLSVAVLAATLLPAAAGTVETISPRLGPGPRVSGVSLQSVALGVHTAWGGASVVGVVTLSSSAPVGGAVVRLSSSDSVNAAVSSVTVAEGQTTASFVVPTQRVSVSETVTITATLGGSSSDTMILNPAAPCASASLTAFNGSNGEYPSALILASDGNFYGTTAGPGFGSIFQMTPSGSITTIYSFTDGTDGDMPGALIQGSDGNLYCLTGGGGSGGYGTLVRLALQPTVSVTTLCSFDGGADGGVPAALMQGGDGNLYGTTIEGGDGDHGTVFRVTLTPTIALTTLVSFDAGADGGLPNTLIQGGDGNLYGTTIGGGNLSVNTGSSVPGGGTVFRLTLSPSIALTTLYSFTFGADGALPSALLQARDGNFYGLTTAAGNTTLSDSSNTVGGGTVFKLTPSGTFSTLYQFTGGTDGSQPAGLIQGLDGCLYGTASAGGAANVVTPVATGGGAVFKITTAGVFMLLKSFAGGTDGEAPCSDLVEGANGTLYGISYFGGEPGVGDETSGFGTAFKLTLPLPFDLTGAGSNDILWQNTLTGDLTYWRMSGTTPLSSGAITNVSTDWRIVAQPDINGDGWPDLLWQSQSTGAVVYWLMNGPASSGVAGWITSGVPGWKVVACVDMNGDGEPDLVWQNESTGAVVCWFLVGGVPTGGAWITSSASSGCQVVAAADLFGDGNNDLIWWNSQTGDVDYWRMNGVTPIGSGAIFDGISTDWRVAGMEDLDGDGHPDLLWQNQSTGALVYWQMIGATPTGVSAWITNSMPAGVQAVGM